MKRKTHQINWWKVKRHIRCGRKILEIGEKVYTIKERLQTKSKFGMKFNIFEISVNDFIVTTFENGES